MIVYHRFFSAPLGAFATFLYAGHSVNGKVLCTAPRAFSSVKKKMTNLFTKSNWRQA